MTQVLLVGITPDGARLQAREWGGEYIDQWADYVAPPDPKRPPLDVLDKLQPVFGRILLKQGGNVTHWITVTP
jgi:hypothetical protein